ncbi:hypothetical protein ACJIZ3_011900 [Penstemon smallii]|uniref:(S)-ureidoglycine aminohydrolase cupin domain-containing protein n=1 Tax=Penstemon smallii TaxID=265156 RepID=A0ABD3UNM6_9LAMI
MAAESSSSAAEPSSSNPKIIVQSNPSESQLSDLGIKSWPKWACSPGKYQLKFDAQETCYLVRGKVKVYLKNSSSQLSGEVVEFGARDLVIIPKGLSCTWDVSVAVDKHYGHVCLAFRRVVWESGRGLRNNLDLRNVVCLGFWRVVWESSRNF